MTAPPIPHDFDLLLPPGWVRLPADIGAESMVTELVNRRFMALPEGQRVQVRAALRKSLIKQAVDAGEMGARDLLLCLDPIRDKPVSAACIISVAPPSPAGEATLPELIPFLFEDGGEVTLVPLAGDLAIRRRIDRDAVPDLEAGNSQRSAHVDYVVPVPHSGAHLMFSFSTTTSEVATELVTLFDAIAGTLRWRA